MIYLTVLIFVVASIQSGTGQTPNPQYIGQIDNKLYFASPTSMTWHAAKTFCAAGNGGMQLGEILTNEQQAFLLPKLRNLVPGNIAYKEFWIGSRDMIASPELLFWSSSNSSLDNGSFSPNVRYSSPNTCVSIRATRTDPGHGDWIVKNCGSTGSDYYGVLCEILLPSCTAI